MGGQLQMALNTQQTVCSLCKLWDGGVATTIDLTCEGTEFNSELSLIPAYISGTLSYVTSSLSPNPYSTYPSSHHTKRFNQLELFHLFGSH